MAVDLTNTQAIAAAALVAYANETLQAVKALNLDEIAYYCSYEGPCAIGVSLDPETRAAWDKEEGQSISAVIRDGRAIGDEDALAEMQAVHDRFAASTWSENAHLDFLIVTEFYARGLDK